MQGTVSFSKSGSEYISPLSILFMCFDFFLASFWVLAYIFWLVALHSYQGCTWMMLFFLGLVAGLFMFGRQASPKRGNYHCTEANLTELNKYRAMYLIVTIECIS